MFNTAHYTRYDLENPQPPPRTLETYNNTYKLYDGYQLYVNPNLTNAHNIPAGLGVRLDDLTCSIALPAFSQNNLNKNFESEFDVRRMPRAVRMPLGLAAKEYHAAGDVDTHGKVLEQGQQGWFYLWWRGLHMLCGREGLDTGQYMVRPSFEKFECKGFGWYIGSRAIIQAKADMADLDISFS